MTNRTPLGQFLYEKRKQMGKTSQALNKELGLPVNYISLLERGMRQKVREMDRQKLCNAFGISMEELFRLEKFNEERYDSPARKTEAIMQIGRVLGDTELSPAVPIANLVSDWCLCVSEKFPLTDKELRGLLDVASMIINRDRTSTVPKPQPHLV